MKRSGGSFPVRAWAWCECGCGWEGEDDVTQWCLEEAAWDRFEWSQPGPEVETVTAASGSPDLVAAQSAMRDFAKGGR